MSGLETTQVDIGLINQGFINQIENGMVKEAEESASGYIREKIREMGFLRRLFDPRTVTADELDPNLDDDKPSIRVEKEPNEVTATYVPYKGTADRRYFTGNRFDVPFGKIESERIRKSKFELMTIRMDIMAWLKENQVKAIQDAEDTTFMDTITELLAMNPAQAASVAIAGDTTFKEAFNTGRRMFNTLQMPIGKVLMSKNTWLECDALRHDVIGNEAISSRFRDGVDDETTFQGIPVVTTIKNNLVADGEMFFFSPKDYFGKFYLLQDATLFLKQEADMINFHTYEAPGFGIGNTKGVVKVSIT